MRTRRRLIVCATVAGTLVIHVAARPLLTAQQPRGVRLHHVHMNVVDPARTAAFYLSGFAQTRPVTVAGWSGVQSEDVFILFNKVAAQASADWDTPFWHFGWNSPDTVGDHARLSAAGVPFFRVPPPSGHMRAPDGNDVEIAPGGATSGGTTPRAFNHVHLMSDAPLCAADWYERMLGMRRLPAMGQATAAPPPADCHVPFEPRHAPANQVHEPNARVMMGDIGLFIYPNQRLEALTDHAIDRPGPLVSPKGRVLDHIGLAVDNLTATLGRLRQERTRILEDVHPFGNTSMTAALVEGPDAMVLELVEMK